LPDRYGSFVEEIGVEAKNRIMELIRKNEKSGVVFFSGDVHYS
jgi:phosphodiesterase/alkaline phosphatase D-like protein